MQNDIYCHATAILISHGIEITILVKVLGQSTGRFGTDFDVE